MKEENDCKLEWHLNIIKISNNQIRKDDIYEKKNIIYFITND